MATVLDSRADGFGLAINATGFSERSSVIVKSESRTSEFHSGGKIVNLRLRGLPPTEVEHSRSKTKIFEQKIALHQVLSERDFYGCPGMYLVPIRPIKEHKVICCAIVHSFFRA